MIRLLCQLLIPILLFTTPASQFVTALSSVKLRVPPEYISDISYEETFEEIENPGMGFYQPVYIHYLTSGNEINEVTYPLVHLRLDISQFSGSCNRIRDMELTQDMLDALDGTLENLEKEGSCAIIRFAYDPWFRGGATYEPSMQMILRHQEQIGEILTKRKEAVISVECGIFGKWGEMHGSGKCKQENFNQVIDQWLAVLPDTIPISVRTPGQYCGWLGIERDALSKNVTQPGEKAYRVGIYNDGYLGSDTDWGTYENRGEEIAWLSNQARHTVFGGEIGTGSQRETVKPTAEYMAVEGFLTHTTYLNGVWHESVFGAMKREDYQGEDARYQGQKGFTYIKNRMGYRFVIRAVAVTVQVPQGEQLVLLTDIENVGFANLVKPKELTLILKSEEYEWRRSLADLSGSEGEGAENMDPRQWNSNETISLRAVVRLPEDIPVGEYKMFLRAAAYGNDGVDGVAGYPIRFANEGEDFWSEELGANFLGRFFVQE